MSDNSLFTVSRLGKQWAVRHVSADTGMGATLGKFSSKAKAIEFALNDEDYPYAEYGLSIEPNPPSVKRSVAQTKSPTPKECNNG